LENGYHQVQVDKDGIPKMAIITPSGPFEFNFLPFGLKNAAQMLQRLMDSLFYSFIIIFIYLDDILVFSNNRTDNSATSNRSSIPL
jgi:hypothetical protein